MFKNRFHGKYTKMAVGKQEAENKYKCNSFPDKRKGEKNMSFSIKEKQQEERKTVKERSFTLRLSDEDVERLFEKSAMAGMAPGELLENFVGDLVYGTCCNGGAESDCADMWFERCGFDLTPKDSFFSYLQKECVLWDAIQCLEEIEDAKSRIKDFSEEIQSGIHWNKCEKKVESWEENFPTREKHIRVCRWIIRDYAKEMMRLLNIFENDYWKPYVVCMEQKNQKVKRKMKDAMAALQEFSRLYDAVK